MKALLSLFLAVSLLGQAAPAFSSDNSIADTPVTQELPASDYAPIVPHAGESNALKTLDLKPQGDHKASEYEDKAYSEKAHYTEEKKSGLPQLNPQWYASQIFWLAVMFSFMYLPFRFKVIPDLSSVIERRREQIEGDLIAARNLKQEAEDVHDSYEKILKDAREEASALFIRAEDKIADLETSTFETFHKKSVEQLAALDIELVNAKDKAMKSIHDVVAEAATQAAAKISGIDVAKDAVLSSLGENVGKKAA